MAGERQIFERKIPVANGESRDTVATYTPDIVDGIVVGFSVHAVDITRLREREMALAQTIRDVIFTLVKTKGSFRSKDLGDLRQRLEHMLVQLEGA